MSTLKKKITTLKFSYIVLVICIIFILVSIVFNKYSKIPAIVLPMSICVIYIYSNFTSKKN